MMITKSDVGTALGECVENESSEISKEGMPVRVFFDDVYDEPRDRYITRMIVECCHTGQSFTMVKDSLDVQIWAAAVVEGIRTLTGMYTNYQTGLLKLAVALENDLKMEGN